MRSYSDTAHGLAPTTAATPGIRVVGLDLSLTGSGVVTLSEGGLGTNLIGSTGKRGDSIYQRAARTDGSTHDRSGLWWQIIAELAPHGHVVEVAPGTLKKYATGAGNAGKDAMLAAAIRRYPDAEIVNNNVADAMHLCAMGARYLGNPLEADTVKIAEAMAVPKWNAAPLS